VSKKQDTAIAEVPTSELAASNASGIAIASSDIDVPRINVVQKTSDIEAPLGAVVLDKQHTLAEADQSVPVTVLSVIKGWRENIDYDSDEIPRIAYTQEEANQIDQNSEYDMLEFAEITLLFRQPEGNDDEAAYPFAIGEENYAIGRINVAKDAYRQTFKRLATFAAFNPKASLQHRVWEFKSSLISRGKYSWFAPSLGITQDEPSEAVKAFVESFA
tara:strand:- start:7803 stop:8453 length:651 start_codon:yes stop_codon:yes gene_type:complete